MDVIELEFCYNPNVGAASRGMDPNISNIAITDDATSVEDAVKKVYSEVFDLVGEELEDATEGDYTPEYLIQFGDDQDASGGDPILFWVNIAGKHYESSIWEESDFEYEGDDWDDDDEDLDESAKKDLREDGRAFGQRFRMPKKDFDAWQKATSKDGLADVRDIDGVKACYVNSFDKTYGRNMPKHIGTWNPETEELACDDVSLFGHGVTESASSHLNKIFETGKIEEKSRVVINFDDSDEAKEFKEEMKKRFNYPKTTSKYQVVHGTSDSGKSVFVESKKNLKESDDYDEPAFNIYCLYSDEGGGETDGEPRYEEVEFDDLEDTIKSIRDSFLKGTLKGSYTWSPVDYTDESGDYTGMSTEEYENYEYKDECELNRLKIYCAPVRGTEDDYVVIIRGDGKVIKDTYGIDYVPEDDDLMENKNMKGRRVVEANSGFKPLGELLDSLVGPEEYADFLEYASDYGYDFEYEDPNAVWPVAEIQELVDCYRNDEDFGGYFGDPELHTEYDSETGEINLDMAYTEWVQQFAPNYDVADADAWQGGVELAGGVCDQASWQKYTEWYESFAPNYDIANADTFVAGYKSITEDPDITCFESATPYKNRGVTYEGRSR